MENKTISTTRSKFLNFVIEFKIIFIFLVFFIGMTFASPYFLTGINLMNIVRQISINAILAIGMTYVILLAGIDLSVGAIIAFASVVTAGILSVGMPIWVAIIGGILMGTLLGLINGLVIAKFVIPPFVMTLAMMTMARGGAYVFTNGRPIVDLPKDFLVIGQGDFLGIPCPVLIMLAVFIMAFVLLYFTRFGRYIYAIGGNLEAARFSGINIFKITTLVYTLSGLFAGIAGVILTSRINTGNAIAGTGYELDAIAAVIIGGTSFSGGVGNLLGTLVGALIIGLINNGLNLLNVDQYWQLIVKGLIIVIAVIIDVKFTKK